jgi:hypothetical protein
MNFLERVQAVLHNQPPDVVPFAPYDNLVPRGEFERTLRNRGMGMCARISTIYATMPNVSVEYRTVKDTLLTIYHTPEGDISKRTRQHAGRVSDNQSFELEGLIKSKKDYDTAIFMLDDTVFHVDNNVYYDKVRDLGGDGIVRDSALDMEASPYAAVRTFYGEISGLDSWIYAQEDLPDHFAALVAAQTRRDERRLMLAVESPAEFVNFGWLEGMWSPAKFRKHELPFYEKWVSYLQSRGKICALHCDATNTLDSYKEMIRQTGVKVVEAFTPPPVGTLSLKEARAAWGQETVIWVNVPETIFYSGADSTRQYMRELLLSDPPGTSLVIGFTEMGTWGATDDETGRLFREGTLAVMDAIDEVGRYPIGIS